MIKLNQYLFNTKPGTFFKVAGFFIYCYILLSACGTARRAAASNTSTTINAAQNDPVWSDRRADSLFMEAVKAKMLNKNSDALANYKLFAQVRPNEPAAHYEVARLMQALHRDPASAIVEMEKAIALDSSNRWFQHVYADLLSFDGKYEQAAQVYGHLATFDRFPEEARLKEALLYQKANMPERALAIFDTLEQSGMMDNVDILIFKQQIHQSSGNIQAAVVELRKLVELQPDELDFLILLSEALERLGERAESDKIMERVARDFGQYPEAQYPLLEHYLHRKDSNKIHAFFKKAMNNSALERNERNNLLMLLMQYEKAEPEMNGLTETTIKYMADEQPNDIDAIALYADFLSATQKYDLAAVQYKRLLVLDSTREDIWLQLLFNYTFPQTADSLVYYGQKMTHLFPNNGMAQYLLGLGYQFLNEATAAARALERSLQLQPNAPADFKVQTYILLGDAYYSLTNFEASDSSFERALRLEPENVSALNNYSYYLSERGVRLEDAARMSAKTLVLQPNEATFLDTYGWILYRQGKYKDARKYLQQAVTATRYPDATLLEHLGDVELKLNNRKRALELWKQALQQHKSSSSLENKIKEHE
jgi:tetratricopeptide (TPR) repeat protein